MDNSVVTVDGDGIAIVSGKVGRGIVGCGDGGGVCRFRWLVRASSMISMAVSSVISVRGDEVGVVIVVVGKRRMSFLCCLRHPFIPFLVPLRP